MALEHVTKNMNYQVDTKKKMWVITDSQSSVSILSTGPGSQYGTQSNKIWGMIMTIAKLGLSIKFQWIPGHRQIEGNEEADVAAGEASRLSQEEVPIDFSTIKAAVKRHIIEKDREEILPAASFPNKVT